MYLVVILALICISALDANCFLFVFPGPATNHYSELLA